MRNKSLKGLKGKENCNKKIWMIGVQGSRSGSTSVRLTCREWSRLYWKCTRRWTAYSKSARRLNKKLNKHLNFKLRLRRRLKCASLRRDP